MMMARDRIRVTFADPESPLVTALAVLLRRQGDIEARDIRTDVWTRGDAPHIVLLTDFSTHLEYDHVFPRKYLDLVDALTTEKLALGKFPVPLILTREPKIFERNGFEFPPELIFGIDPKTANASTAAELVSRIRCLHKTWCPRFHPELMRDFIVTKLRLMLGIGESHHDVTAEFDAWLRQLREWNQTGRADLERRKSEVDNRLAEIQHLAGTPHPSMYGIFFRRTLEELRGRLEQMSESIVRPERRTSVNTLAEQIASLERAFPSKSGSAISMLALTRPWVLVIDDEAEHVAECLAAQEISREHCTLRLDDLCRFLPFTKQRKSFREIRVELEKFLTQPQEFREDRREKGDDALHDVRAIDYVLLDLSFGERGKELGGLELLRLLRAHSPETPVVVHSTYGHSSHIINAIQNGANWFSRKEQTRRLAFDMLSLHNPSHWQMEWNRIKERSSDTGTENVPMFDGEPLADDEQYIVYKLLENIPGETIVINKITSGLGGSKTLYTRRQKDSVADTAPVIVKLAQPFEMLSEALRYRRFIYPYIDNLVGRVDRPLVRAGRTAAGIAYTFTGSYQNMSDSGRRRRSASLREVLRHGAERALPFSHYRQLFERLFNHVLPRLHRAASRGGDEDFPNVLLDETKSPHADESFTFRLPPAWEVELTDFCEAVEGTDSVVDDGDTITLHNVYVSEVKNGLITVTGRTDRAYRARLVGDVASFIARYFVIRPHKHLTIRGRRLRDDMDIWDEIVHDVRTTVADGMPDLIETIQHLRATVPQEQAAIVHGDLNLSNVMVEVEDADISRLTSNTPWLIDFARTRRDTIVHDFAALETSLATELLRSSFVGNNAETDRRLIDFFNALRRSPLDVPTWVKGSSATMFAFEAISATRAAAAAAGIESTGYLAAVALYYLIVLKVIGPAAKNTAETSFAFKRRVAFHGFAVAAQPIVEAASASLSPVAADSRSHRQSTSA